MSSLPRLLEEQYSCTERYANAQTALFNAVTTSSQRSSSPTPHPVDDDDDNVGRAVKKLGEARCRVRSNWADIQRHPVVKKQYPNHVALSQRVLRTIASNPSWHANGLPTLNLTQSHLQTNTVALASLKASIVGILEMEQD